MINGVEEALILLFAAFRYNKYTLENFKEQFGENVYVTETPRGGFHVVFEYEPRMETWSQVTGIDGYTDDGWVHSWCWI